MSVKHDNFKRIAEQRMDKIVLLISKLQNLSNSSFYEYSEEEIDAIFNKIQIELDKQRGYFKDKRKNKGKIEL